MVYNSRVGVIKYPSIFWKVAAIIFAVLAIGAVLLALHCSDMLDCIHTYEDGGKTWCVSEIDI